MTKDKINKSQVFVLLMCFLIVPFLYGFITDINGDQGLVLIGRASNYMADYYNVAEYSATRNPYGYGREDEIVDASEREYPPLAYVIGYYQSKAVDYVHMQGLEAGRTDLGLSTSACFMFFMHPFIYFFFIMEYTKTELIMFDAIWDIYFFL